MIFTLGSPVLLAHRRLFELDHARFFVGIVDAYDAGILRLRGYTWLRDAYTGDFEQKPDERVKVFSIASGTAIVYVLPNSTEVRDVRFEKAGKRVVVRDSKGFEMDLTEGTVTASRPQSPTGRTP